MSIDDAISAGFLVLILVPLPFCDMMFALLNHCWIIPFIWITIRRKHSVNDLSSLMAVHRFVIYVTSRGSSALVCLHWRIMFPRFIAVFRLIHLAHWVCVSFSWFGVILLVGLLVLLETIVHEGPLHIFVGVLSLSCVSSSSFNFAKIFVHTLLLGIWN